MGIESPKMAFRSQFLSPNASSFCGDLKSQKYKLGVLAGLNLLQRDEQAYPRSHQESLNLRVIVRREVEERTPQRSRRRTRKRVIRKERPENTYQPTHTNPASAADRDSVRSTASVPRVTPANL